MQKACPQIRIRTPYTVTENPKNVRVKQKRAENELMQPVRFDVTVPLLSP